MSSFVWGKCVSMGIQETRVFSWTLGSDRRSTKGVICSPAVPWRQNSKRDSIIMWFNIYYYYARITPILCVLPIIPVDPAGGHCYWNPIKTCESRVVRPPGKRLSNTWIIYPWKRYNLGKLRIIPHRSWMLECPKTKSVSVQGWVCGLSGSSGCKGPTSRWRVRALRGGARRWDLRHDPRPYGVQQLRNLHTVGNHDEGIPSANTQCWLFICLKRRWNKGRVRRVPAAAVTPAARVVVIIIELKASVAGLVNLWVNWTAQPSEFQGDC